MNEITNTDMENAVQLPVVEGLVVPLAPVDGEAEVIGYVQEGEGEVATEVTVI